MKKYYVDGGILIETPFFNCQELVAGCPSLPEDCELIPTNYVVDGYDCLLIDDEHPQTMFAEYFAKSFVSTNCIAAEYYYATKDSIHMHYFDRIKEALSLLTVSTEENKTQIIRRQVFMMMVAAFDTYIADTVLLKILNNKDLFYAYAIEFVESSKQRTLHKLLTQENMGEYEAAVIGYVLKNSYSSSKVIRELYENKTLFGFSLNENLQKMEKYFNQRHLIAHRNGREKSGRFRDITIQEIESLKLDSINLVQFIHEQL